MMDDLRGRPVGRGNPPPESPALPPEFAWMQFGVCNDYDPEAWFPENEILEGTYAILKCEQCTVKIECLEFALDNNEEFGIWGALHSRDRRRRGRRVLARWKKDRGDDLHG